MPSKPPTPQGISAPLRKAGYNHERDRHRDNARRALLLAKQRVESALARLDGEPSSLLAADTRNAGELLVEAHGEVRAYLALHEVRFLVENETGQED